MRRMCIQKPRSKVCLGVATLAAVLISGAATLAQNTKAPIKIEVDLREAPRRIFHARLDIPTAAGPLTLVYPQWIPGEHGPTGPIADRSEEHTSELQSQSNLVCRLLLEKKKKKKQHSTSPRASE